MSHPKALVFLAAATALAGCSGGSSAASPDIAHVAEVKSTFGPQFHVTDVAPTGIDPRMLSNPAMPPGVSFEPADCAKFAEAQLLPPGLKGNMAATTAEGDGNRFITMAVETSETVPVNDPSPQCRKVGFAGGGTRGLVEQVEAPTIADVHTLGTHRVVQTVVGGQPRTGELYNYVANFGTTLVIVTANPLVVPGQPVVPVNTQKARDLLVAAVAAVKGS
jgi:hypothetical protein